MFGWLAEEEQPGAPGGDKPGILTGLTGELPWLGDIAAPDAGADQPGGAPSGEEVLAGAFDLDSAALDWQSVSDVSAPETPARPAIRRLQFDSVESTPTAGSEATQADWLPPEMESKPAEPVPDWLSAAEGFLDEAEAAPEAGTPAAPLPDWLSAQGSDEGEASDLAVGEPTPVPGEATPDWLSAADSLFDEEETPAEVEPLPAVDAGSTPDWLTGAADFAAETGVAEEEYLEAGPQARAEGGPEWLITETGEISARRRSRRKAARPTKAGWPTDEKEYQPTQEELLAAEVPDWFQTIEETPEAAETRRRPRRAARRLGRIRAGLVPGAGGAGHLRRAGMVRQKRISTDLLKSAPELPTQPPEPPPPVEAQVPAAPANPKRLPPTKSRLVCRDAGRGRREAARSARTRTAGRRTAGLVWLDWGSGTCRRRAAAVEESRRRRNCRPSSCRTSLGELIDLNEPEEARRNQFRRTSSGDARSGGRDRLWRDGLRRAR